MKPGLQFKLSQSLALTPQLQQSIRLLQLSTQELEQEIDQMLLDNPLLEKTDDEADEAAPAEAAPLDAPADAAADAMADTPAVSDVERDTAPEQAEQSFDLADRAVEVATEPAPSSDAVTEMDTPDWDGASDGAADWSFDDAAGSERSDDDDYSAADHSTPRVTLRDHLRQQLCGRMLSAQDRLFAEAVIDSLDDDGWLTDPLESLVESLFGAALEPEQREEAIDGLATAMRLVQSFDPAGVAARNLPECLCLQLQARTASPLQRIALTLCEGHLDALAKRDYKRVARLLDTDEEDIRAAHLLIMKLNPRPASGFATETAREVVPDVIVQRLGGTGVAGFRVSLNAEVLPKLRVNQLYASILRQQRGDSPQALHTHLQEARWFIKNVQQRFDTILRVSQAIVERQRSFFLYGASGMRPLVLKEIADQLGLHESTISRVTTAKYMSTPFGTFELKYFFTSGVATDTGGSASSTAVKSLIKKLVEGEDAAKPLSDNEIADCLAQQGIVIARRTVAKYREALRIAPANLRRTV
ncbi:MAG: RNA polymerase factor sigma-54 [Betaproteobacteria bacterium]|nr:RNA polymerase factor sigma-54 [Betaproteobacteria bacterium]